MKISVITVCYNSEKTIEKAIQSVLSQKYYDLEYIIIDGGSIDNTLQIIKKYGDNISCCISEPDNGIYDAMNKGLKKASGDIVAFLNSDDWYAPDVEVFKKVEDYFDDSNADIVSGNIYIYQNEIIEKIQRNKMTEENVFLGIVCPHPAMFVKKKLYSKFGKFDTAYRIAADTKWTVEAYLNGANFLCVEDYFTYFRVGGISTDKIYSTYKEQYDVMLSCARKYQLAQMERKIIDFYSNGLKNLEKEKYIEAAFEEKQEEIKMLFDYHKKYYIWGAGKRGSRCLQIFEKLGIPVIGFIDSNKRQESEKGFRIIQPEKIDAESYICITPKDYEEQIKTELERLGVEKKRFFTYSSIMEKIEKIGGSSHLLTEELKLDMK